MAALTLIEPCSDEHELQRERERHALFQVLVGQASGSSANRPTS
jgi:hypothetical protein